MIISNRSLAQQAFQTGQAVPLPSPPSGKLKNEGSFLGPLPAGEQADVFRGKTDAGKPELFVRLTGTNVPGGPNVSWFDAGAAGY
jgi:hypothetical protein